MTCYFSFFSFSPHRSSNPRIASVNKMMMSKLRLREGNEETVLNHNWNKNILTQEACTDEDSKPASTRLQGRLNDFSVKTSPKIPTLLMTKEPVSCYHASLISHSLLCLFLHIVSIQSGIFNGGQYELFNVILKWFSENPSEIQNLLNCYDSGLWSSQKQVRLCQNFMIPKLGVKYLMIH